MPQNLSPFPKTKTTLPIPWKDAQLSELAQIRGVCLDIDDTLSTHGKLTAQAFEALWKLKDSGFIVVPVTGRPAGWCDHFARFWPVDAVVGENGAFTFFMEAGIRKRINSPTLLSLDEMKTQLHSLSQEILIEFPHAKWASDQNYREFDLAIDICEDVPAWQSSDIQKLIQFCTQKGAHAKLSSIHVNIWFGNYDKKTGFEHWIKSGLPGLKDKPPLPEQWLYIGDSPNDEPMFSFFPYSVGVANLNAFLSQIQSFPTWITEKSSGEGFNEMVEKLIRSQKVK